MHSAGGNRAHCSPEGLQQADHPSSGFFDAAIGAERFGRTVFAPDNQPKG
jgi:hypothetical protein